MIDSGTLEAYALGGLQAEEELELRKLIKCNQAVREKVNELYKLLERFAQENAVKAPRRY